MSCLYLALQHNADNHRTPPVECSSCHLQGFLRFVQPSKLALSTKVAAEHLDTAKDCQAETVLALAVVVVAARERS
jgi:hypothetical protein